MPIDRRATIAAALDAAEANNGEVPEDFTPPETDDAGNVVDPAKTLVDENKRVVKDDKLGNGETVNEEVAAPAVDKPKVGEAPKPDEDKAPQSWRAAQKAKWSTVDPEVKQEIQRRERDHERVLSESAQTRQFAQYFHQTVSPYMARVQAMGVHPLVAVREFFKADHALSNGTEEARAAQLVKLFYDYNINLETFDKVLTAEHMRRGGTPADPVSSQVSQLLAEQLRPLQEFVQSQRTAEQQRQEQEARAASASIEQMALDNVKYPHFQAVANDMADIIEIQSKKGLYLTPEQAYTRAVAMNPEVSQQVQQQQQQTAQQLAAQRKTQRAQRALAASSSVAGAPNGTPSGGSGINVKDRRAVIESAFDQLEGR